MKILVVDDSATARAFLKKLLKKLDYTDTVEASNGREALEVLSNTSDINLVLLDRYMPVMDGLEFMQEFKKNPQYQYILVSMVTMEDDMNEKMKTIADYRADYYITKPVTKDSLIRMFAKLFYSD